MPPRYYDHRVVRETVDGTLVYPYTLYVGGIRFTRTDNVIAFWMCSMITFHRHLCVVVRKSELCNCRCRGWDTIYPIMLMLNHSFVALARGILPSARHDGQLEPPPLLIFFPFWPPAPPSPSRPHSKCLIGKPMLGGMGWEGGFVSSASRCWGRWSGNPSAGRRGNALEETPLVQQLVGKSLGLRCA